jgi:hypothetical protein
MTKKYSAHFRYEDDEARSIDTILDYIRENAPGTAPNTSDAIRFALLTKAADIRMERSKEIKMDKEYKLDIYKVDEGADDWPQVDIIRANSEQGCFDEAFRLYGEEDYHWANPYE